MSTKLTIAYSELFNPDDGFEKLKKEYKELGEYVQATVKEIKAAYSGMDVSDSMKVKELQENVAVAKKAQGSYISGMKTLQEATEKLSKLREEENKSIIENSKANDKNSASKKKVNDMTREEYEELNKAWHEYEKNRNAINQNVSAAESLRRAKEQETATLAQNTQAVNKNEKAIEDLTESERNQSALLEGVNKTIRGNLGGLKDTAVENTRLKTALSQVTAQLKIAQQAYEQNKTKKNAQEVQELTVAQTRLRSALAESNSVMKNQIAEQDAASGSIEQMRRQLSLLTIAWKNASPEARKSIDEQKKQLNELIKDAEAKTGDFRRNVGNYPEAFKDITSNAVQSLESSLDNASGGILGKVKGIASGFGGVGIALTAAVGLAAAWGNELVKITKEYSKLRGEIQKTTGQQGEQLDKLVAQTVALERTFGDDRNAIVRAQNTLMKEFNVSAQEAFEIIESGYLSAANANGDMLDSIIEYSAQIKASGGSARQLISILDSSGKQGIFSDKGIDTVKEFGLRIREQTKATREALEGAFGKQFTDKLLKGISNGSITSTQGLQMVAKAMEDTTIPAEKLQTVIADVFGGPGEDAGLKFIKSLKDISGETKRVYDLTNPLVRVQKEQLQIEKNLAEQNNRLSKQYESSVKSISLFADSVKVGLKQAFVDASSWVANFGQNLSNAFSGGGASWKIVLQDLTRNVYELTEAEKQNISQTRTLNEMRKISSQLIKDEVFDLNNKLTALHDSNLSEDERARLMDEIMDKYPSYLQYIVDEEGNLIDLTNARINLNKAIINSAIVRTKEALIQRTMDKLIENQIANLEEEAEIQDKINFLRTKNGRLAEDTIKSYERQLEKVRAKNKQEQDLLLADLKNFEKNSQSLFNSLVSTFSDMNLDAGFDAFADEIKRLKNEIKTAKVEIDYLIENKSKVIAKVGQSGFDKQLDGLNKELIVLQKQLEQTIKQRNDLLGIKPNGSSGGDNGTSKTRLEGIKKERAAELDLIYEIKRRKLEYQKETYERDLSLLNLRVQKEIEGFEKLRKQQDEYRRKGLIDEKEYQYRIAQINEISYIAEQERYKAAVELRVKYYETDMKLFQDNLKKQYDLQVAQYKILAIEQGKSQEEINNYLIDLELQHLMEMYDAVYKERIKREAEILELRSKDTLTEDEKIRLDALTKENDLLQQEYALRLKISKIQKKSSEEFLNDLSKYSETIRKGQIDVLTKEITKAYSTITKEDFAKLTKAQQDAAIESYKKLLEERRVLYIEQIKAQFRDEMAKYEEGSLKWLEAEERKRQALLKINEDYNAEVEKLNDQTVKSSVDKFKSVYEQMAAFLDKLFGELEKSFQKTIDNAQRRLEKQNAAVEHQRTLAEKGLENTYIYELQLQEKREKELAQAQKRLENLEKAKAFYAAFSANVSSSKNSGEALAKTIADFAKLEIAIRAISGLGFEKGGYTGDVGTKQVAGVVHGKEFVIDAATTSKLGLKGKDMNYFKNTFMQPKGLFDFNQLAFTSGLISGVNKGMGNSDVVNELKAVQEILKNNTSFDADALANGILKTTKRQGNYIKRNIYIKRK